MYQYGTGSHPPPGGQHGMMNQGPPGGQQHGMVGQGQGWHQQQQQHHQPQGQGWQNPPGPPQPQQRGFMQQGQPPHPPSDHYGNYGQQFSQNVFSINAWQAMSFNSEDEFQRVFHNKKSPVYQGIQAEELCEILNTTQRIRDYYRITWSLELCKIMIAMLDRNKDGIMQWPEFTELLQCLIYWHRTFCEYDTNRTGFIEAGELGTLIRNKFHYSLSAKALECILKRYSRAMDDRRCLIAFDDFVSMSVRLRTYTEAFRARDRNTHQGREQGGCLYGYDDFLQCTMCL